MPGQDRRPSGAALAPPAPPLRDDFVALRPWRADDFPERLMTFADPLVQRFAWAGAAPYTADDAREYLAAQEAERLRGEGIAFVVVAPGDDTAVLGGASLYGVDRAQRRAIVGYWLVAGARGRGLATRALRLLAGWSFEHVGIARLELTCAPENAASAAVAERCGFQREGVLRSHMVFKGARRDTVMFSLLPGELR